MPTCARLVYDGSESVIHIPPQMLQGDGTDVEKIQRQNEKRPDQLQGTTREILGELASRVCYDSCGIPASRSSKDLHKHILEVGNTSVYEHCAFTVELYGVYVPAILSNFMNRPCLYVEPETLTNKHIRITINPRHIIDWCKVYCPIGEPQKESGILRDMLLTAAYKLCPEIFTTEIKKVNSAAVYSSCPAIFSDFTNALTLPASIRAELVEPQTNNEKWVTLFLAGSRGFSHEQVRHGDWTAISQRSTRYVDESESEWVMHPLIRAYCADKCADGTYAPLNNPIDIRSMKSMQHCRATYQKWVDALQPWLISRGVDKFSARKQARGAARGYLGNALYTEMLFSASVAQWRWMLSQRLSNFADAEIREVYAQVLIALRESRYADCFADIETEAASDGIGIVAKGFVV